MSQENEKPVLVRWYYSYSEWESFIKWEKKKKEIVWMIESAMVWVLGFITICFGRNTPWFPSLMIGAGIAVIYGIAKVYLRKVHRKWKLPQMPEVVITNGSVMVNGKLTVFHGEGKWLRKADIKEKDNINILEISYEWNTGKGTTYDELRLPVPKGKLREAMELLDKLDFPGANIIGINN